MRLESSSARDRSVSKQALKFNIFKFANPTLTVTPLNALIYAYTSAFSLRFMPQLATSQSANNTQIQHLQVCESDPHRHTLKHPYIRIHIRIFSALHTSACDQSVSKQALKFNIFRFAKPVTADFSSTWPLLCLSCGVLLPVAA
jgi:hypothetical protein